jgi:hypothetical protein
MEGEWVDDQVQWTSAFFHVRDPQDVAAVEGKLVYVVED